MTTVLKKYIREINTRKPIGVAVLVRDGKDNLLGYSLCNPKDQFDKKLGYNIALARATHPKLVNDEVFAPSVPERAEVVREHFEYLEDRAERYFKS
jgi:hypothetical protein